MKKILFFGDSITDWGRNYNNPDDLGSGYPLIVASDLAKSHPGLYHVINRGISGNRVVDLYARIKCDCWNIEPDYLFILIGINDIWHEIGASNGVDIKRFEKVYDMLIEDTLDHLKDTKIILLEPFVLKGGATIEAYDKFLEVKDYAKVVNKLANKYHLDYLPLQEKIDDLANKIGNELVLSDGVHPALAGARLIADEIINYLNK